MFMYCADLWFMENLQIQTEFAVSDGSSWQHTVPAVCSGGGILFLSFAETAIHFCQRMLTSQIPEVF